jgi:hypothetical protein
MARRIITLSLVGLAAFGYFIFFKDRNDLVIWFAICLLVAVITYTFQYQVDQLMIRGVPQKLPPAMRELLLRTSPWFASLRPDQQYMMEDRMVRWILKKDFIDKNEQKAPEDVRYIMAFYAVLLTMHQESFLYEGLDRIVFYHHPFLTPTHPDDVHIAEVEIEDGTMIISVPHVIKGHLEKGYYNIALHLMAEAYQKLYLKKELNWDPNTWMKLESISGITKDSIDAYIGLPVTDPWPVAVHHQFVYAGAGMEEVTNVLVQLRDYRSPPGA